MKKVVYLKTPEAVRAFMEPIRLRIINEVMRRRKLTVRQIADEMGESPPKLHYHMRALLKIGVIRVVKTSQKNNLIEKTYQKAAESILIDPGVSEKLRALPDNERRDYETELLLKSLEHIRQEVVKYLDSFDPVKDGTDNGIQSSGWCLHPMYFADGEREEFHKAYKELIAKYEGDGPDKQRYRQYLINYPEADKT